jgi:hypothetical protein
MPLRNQDPSEGKLVPFMVFGFPVLDKNLDDWANHLEINPNLKSMTRREHSWQKLRRSIRAQFKCPTTAIRLPEPECASMCIIIGSNDSPKDLTRVQDMTLIKGVYEVIRTRRPPGWFSPLDSRDLGSGDLGS